MTEELFHLYAKGYRRLTVESGFDGASEELECVLGKEAFYLTREQVTALRDHLTELLEESK